MQRQRIVIDVLATTCVIHQSPQRCTSSFAGSIPVGMLFLVICGIHLKKFCPILLCVPLSFFSLASFPVWPEFDLMKLLQPVIESQAYWQYARPKISGVEQLSGPEVSGSKAPKHAKGTTSAKVLKSCKAWWCLQPSVTLALPYISIQSGHRAGHPLPRWLLPGQLSQTFARMFDRLSVMYHIVEYHIVSYHHV